MSEPGPLGFHTGETSPLILGPGRPAVSREEILAAAESLSGRIRGAAAYRVLVRSDDPLQILSAVSACHTAGVDLWIAHTNLPETVLAETCDRYAIDYLIDDDREEQRAVSGDRSAARRIHMMTSGTTGRPKVAAHTLESLLGRVSRQASLDPNRGGRWLLTYQPTGFAGLQVMLTATLSGGAIVAPADRTPAGFLAAAREFEVTHVSATPTFWRAFLMLVRPGQIGLRQITLGGEGVDQATLDRLRAAFPDARITHIYASTEAGIVFSVHDGREGFPVSWLDQDRDGVQLRIRNGFLQIRSPHLMQRYVSESDQPLQADGWLATADRTEIVGDRVRLIGRQDSTINVGGSKVYPLAVETVLLAVPGVAEARVYGVPNPISGFLVGADVVLVDGEDPGSARSRLLSTCRERLAGYQVPRVLRFVESLLVSASGKKG